MGTAKTLVTLGLRQAMSTERDVSTVRAISYFVHCSDFSIKCGFAAAAITADSQFEENFSTCRTFGSNWVQRCLLAPSTLSGLLN